MVRYNFFILLFGIFLFTSCDKYDWELPDKNPIIQEEPEEDKWKLVWADEFDYEGLPDSEKWSYEEGYVRNNEEQYYTKARLENAFVKDGMLNIKCIKENYPNKDYQNPNLSSQSDEAWKTVNQYAKYTSACLTTLGNYSWTYGKFEIRAKFPTGAGCWPAFWMMGANIASVGWPLCGEIDIFEWVGRTPTKIMGGVHYRNPIDGSNAKAQGGGTIKNASTDFHIYTLEWDENKMEFKCDNITFYTFNMGSAGEIFKKPQYLLLNYALGGKMGLDIDESVLPQTYQIDYVRVYQVKED